MASSTTIFLPNVILDETNYATWVFRMESFLQGLCLYGYINGSTKCPAEEIIAADGTKTQSAAYVAWKAQDQNIINMMGQTPSPRAISCAVGSATAAEMWTNLKSKFADANKQNIMHLKANLHRLKKGQDTIEVYLEKVKSACDALVTVGVVMDDEDIVINVLEGLPSEFTAIKTIIRTQPNCSMSTLKTLLKAAEYDLDQASQSVAPFPLTAMVANNNNFHGNNFGNASGSLPTPYSSQGNMPSYPISSLNAYPAQPVYHQNFLKSNPNSAAFYSNGRGGGSSGTKFVDGVCQLCHKPGHGAKSCNMLASLNSQGKSEDSSPESSVIICQYCGRKYHSADRCFRIIGFPNRRGPSQSRGFGNNNFSKNHISAPNTNIFNERMQGLNNVAPTAFMSNGSNANVCFSYTVLDC